ncbi:lysophospholipase-like protein 1 isoform X1 [Zootoca vivipara]|uniref:lysophospholipase-like protein 1 isoform X1 n=1 Tax=Zootoca vivipara TaxID=8524 RepID=UPI00293BB79E|nr:lysophospholipase-like protein 1 isoform X1 [Zootoca vivipara]
MSVSEAEKWRQIAEQAQQELQQLSLQAQGELKAAKEETKKVQDDRLQLAEQVRALQEKEQQLRAVAVDLQNKLDAEKNKAGGAPQVQVLPGRRAGTLVSKFNGDPREFQGFETEIVYALELHHDEFPDDEHRVAFIVEHLTGAAREWLRPLIATRNPCMKNVKLFLEGLKTMYSSDSHMDQTKEELHNLRQGNMTVRAYWAKFTMLVHRLGWELESPPMQAAFYLGLHEEVKDELSRGPKPSNMDQLSKAALAVGVRQESRWSDKQATRAKRAWFPRSQEKPLPQQPFQATPGASQDQEPMQIDSARARAFQTPAAPRRKEGRGGNCFLCNSPQHLVRDCPHRREWQGKAGTVVPSPTDAAPQQGNGKAWLQETRGGSQAQSADNSPSPPTRTERSRASPPLPEQEWF